MISHAACTRMLKAVMLFHHHTDICRRPSPLFCCTVKQHYTQEARQDCKHWFSWVKSNIAVMRRGQDWPAHGGNCRPSGGKVNLPLTKVTSCTINVHITDHIGSYLHAGPAMALFTHMHVKSQQASLCSIVLLFNYFSSNSFYTGPTQLTEWKLQLSQINVILNFINMVVQ